MISISKLIDTDLVIFNLKASTKSEALLKICEHITQKHKICEPKALFDTIMNRESLHSTAVGHGIAIPHARCDESESLIIAVALIEKGVDFGAIDGIPVNMVFSIIAPKAETASYLQVLSQIASLLHSDNVRRELLSSKTAQEFIEIIKKNERR